VSLSTRKTQSRPHLAFRLSHFEQVSVEKPAPMLTTFGEIVEIPVIARGGAMNARIDFT